MSNRVQSVDGLRLFLFMGECFLLITAYFLTSKLLKQTPQEVKIIPSILNRAKRLYPLYILIVIVMAVVGYVGLKQWPDDFFSYFLFAQNYYWLINPEGSQVFACGHLWYLTLDVYLVLIWLIVFRVTNRKYITPVLIALIVIAICYRAYFSQVNRMMAYTVPLGAMDSFALGGLLAMMMRNGKRSKLPPIIALLIGTIGFLACVVQVATTNDVNLLEGLVLFKTSAGYATNPFTIQVLLFIPLVCFALVWFCLIPRKHFGVLSNPKIVALGTMTYEFYLLHFPILVVLKSIVHNKVVVIIAGLILTYISTVLWNKLYARIQEKRA